MAPARISKAKPKTAATPKPKLKQKTITPNKPPGARMKVQPVTKAPKVKTKPNASILSYFKKTEDEDLFMGGVEGEVGEGGEVDEEDMYGADDYVKRPVEEEGEGERYNENGGSVKKRRLSFGLHEGGEESRAVSVDAESTTVKKEQNEPRKPPAKKKVPNPFLDDSSSDEDGDENETSNDDDSTTPSRVRPTLASADPAENVCETTTGDRLTNGTRITDRDDEDQDQEVKGKVPLLRHETSGANLTSNEGPAEEEPIDELGEEEFDEDITGEELQAMRDMEEQAMLEGYEEFGMDRRTDEEMMEACPICGGSLAGASEQVASEHVNACLDGNPTPLPQPKPPAALEENKEIDGAEVGKRFAKAAVPRPGQANPISFGEKTSAGSSGSAFAKLMSGHAEDTAWAAAAAAENASRGMPAYKRTCPFYKIMPGFSICVDAFRYGAVEGCKAYFLSHFHSDHYIGLTANWTHGPIYCSKVTGSLVKTQLKTAAKYVVELEFDKTVPVPHTKGVTVTMIPANHCPGSSLFLFEKAMGGGKTHRILHCGDFRACQAHLEHPHLRPETIDAVTGKTKHQKIDVCYLDTTYLNPKYSFPPQKDVIATCAEMSSLLNQALISNDDKEWDSLLRRREGGTPSTSVSKFFTTTTNDPPPPPSKPPTPTAPLNAFTALSGNPQPSQRNRLLILCGTYSIGKERICVGIALALESKIYASPYKLKIVNQLDDPELISLLTPNPQEAQVHLASLSDLNKENLISYLEENRRFGFSRIVGFKPSGWNYRPPSLKSLNIKADMAPGSVPMEQLLYGKAWRSRFRKADLIPMRGSTKEGVLLGVPYSEHSSFRELAIFVMGLRIGRVVPTVNVGSEQSRKRMKGWIDRWIVERGRLKGGRLEVKEGVDGREEEEEEEEEEEGVVYW
ncbi:DNA cross-link repair protein PSO2/SNM1 [Podospora pseudocomata]|uniref:DNA cross-link repair protein PSO2/SNM1 n=1 Tax=Podospora pseudocomata TaxID=2093779 RepID=A0ABR0GX36_9PEZI|nr:DNA cross-link repair protein PSO2/SNM1 [Podospora pseudocomata]